MSGHGQSSFILKENLSHFKNIYFLTIFLDCRINDGTEARPYFMPKGLMQFVASADYDLKGHQGAKGGEHQPLNVMR